VHNTSTETNWQCNVALCACVGVVASEAQLPALVVGDVRHRRLRNNHMIVQVTSPPPDPKHPHTEQSVQTSARLPHQDSTSSTLSKRLISWTPRAALHEPTTARKHEHLG
jgi:hypothetical protein